MKNLQTVGRFLHRGAASAAVILLTACAAVPLLPGAASSRCLSPGESADRDVIRNLALLGPESGLCLGQTRFQEHGRNWNLTIIRNERDDRGPLIYLPHDNENSAFDTALYSLRRYGGTMVAIEADEARSFKGQDPNRNFATSAASAEPCGNMIVKPAPEFTEILRAMNPEGQPFFLTLHNNDDGYEGGGGRGSINVGRSSAIMKGLPAPGSKSDEDDALLLAGTVPFEENKKAVELVAYMHERGIHALYEYIRPSVNDCSFSNYVVLNNLGDYYNIEAQVGHTEEQKSMLDHLMAYLKFRPIDSQ